MHKNSGVDYKSITQITEGTFVNADLLSSNEIHISGKVKGTVKSRETIIIQKNGEVSGDIHGMSIKINGKVNGTIQAERKLFLTSTAVIEGNIYAQMFSIEEGAEFNGEIISGTGYDAYLKEASSIKKTVIDSAVSKNEQKKSVSRYVAKVVILMPELQENLKQIPALLTTFKNLMRSLDYSLDTFDEIQESNLFIHRQFFVKKSDKGPDSILNGFKNIKELFENAFLKKNGNQKDDLTMKLINEVITLLSGINDFMILLGHIVIVQYSENDVQSLAIELLSDDALSSLNLNRDFKSPKKIYHQLISQ